MPPHRRDENTFQAGVGIGQIRSVRKTNNSNSRESKTISKHKFFNFCNSDISRSSLTILSQLIGTMGISIIKEIVYYKLFRQEIAKT